MNREEGYYWVKIRTEREWEVAEWYKNEWYLPGNEWPHDESEIFKINETQIFPPNNCHTMTEQDRLNNELIALFMGFTKHNAGHFTDKKENIRFILSYNSIWSELMPVWYKFRDQRFEGIREQFEHGEFRQNIAHEICYGTRESAFQAIVSGIQWYNSINKNNHAKTNQKEGS